MWRLPVENVLAAGLGALPLAPISDVAETDLPRVIQTMEDRIDREAGPDEAGRLWTATGVLMGLRFSGDLIARVLEGVRRMKESVFYQAIVQEGVELGRGEALGEARTLLLELGTDRFGPPSPERESAIREIADRELLHRLARRVAHAASWSDLFEGP